jgi:CheY-like chemotaxis protein
VKPPAENTLLRGLSALVLEDESLISMMIQEMLRDLGCDHVWSAGDAAQAETILETNRPDIAVLDVNLGGGSAINVAEKLDDAQIPFVFATGYGRRGLPQRWSDKLVIQKPFAFEALAAAVRKALDAAPRRPRPEAS